MKNVPLYILTFVAVLFHRISEVEVMMTGGWTSQDVNDPDVQKYAQFAADEISESSNSENRLKVVEVTEASTQVVSGINYKIKLHMGPTDCSRNSVTAISDCNIGECGMRKACTVKIWVRSWLNDTRLTESSCNDHVLPC